MIDIADHIREHHRQEIERDIDRLNAGQAAEESRLDDEFPSPDERAGIEQKISTIEELGERLLDLP